MADIDLIPEAKAEAPDDLTKRDPDKYATLEGELFQAPVESDVEILENLEFTQLIITEHSYADTTDVGRDILPSSSQVNLDKACATKATAIISKRDEKKCTTNLLAGTVQEPLQNQDQAHLSKGSTATNKASDNKQDKDADVVSSLQLNSKVIHKAKDQIGKTISGNTSIIDENLSKIPNNGSVKPWEDKQTRDTKATSIASSITVETENKRDQQAKSYVGALSGGMAVPVQVQAGTKRFFKDEAQSKHLGAKLAKLSNLPKPQETQVRSVVLKTQKSTTKSMQIVPCVMRTSTGHKTNYYQIKQSGETVSQAECTDVPAEMPKQSPDVQPSMVKQTETSDPKANEPIDKNKERVDCTSQTLSSNEVDHSQNEHQAQLLLQAQNQLILQAQNQLLFQALAQLLGQAQSQVLPQVQNHFVPQALNQLLPQTQNQLLPQSQNQTIPLAQSQTLFQTQKQAIPLAQNQTIPLAQKQTISQAQNQILAQTQNQVRAQAQNQCLPHAQGQLILQVQNQTLPEAQKQLVLQTQNQPVTSNLQLPTGPQLQPVSATPVFAIMVNDSYTKNLHFARNISRKQDNRSQQHTTQPTASQFPRPETEHDILELLKSKRTAYVRTSCARCIQPGDDYVYDITHDDTYCLLDGYAWSERQLVNTDVKSNGFKKFLYRGNIDGQPVLRYVCIKNPKTRMFIRYELDQETIDREKRAKGKDTTVDREKGIEQEETAVDREMGSEREETTVDREMGTKQEQTIVDREMGSIQEQTIVDEEKGITQEEPTVERKSGIIREETTAERKSCDMQEKTFLKCSKESALCVPYMKSLTLLKKDFLTGMFKYPINEYWVSNTPPKCPQAGEVYIYPYSMHATQQYLLDGQSWKTRFLKRTFAKVTLSSWKCTNFTKNSRPQEFLRYVFVFPLDQRYIVVQYVNSADRINMCMVPKKIPASTEADIEANRDSQCPFFSGHFLDDFDDSHLPALVNLEQDPQPTEESSTTVCFMKRSHTMVDRYAADILTMSHKKRVSTRYPVRAQAGEMYLLYCTDDTVTGIKDASQMARASNVLDGYQWTSWGRHNSTEVPGLVKHVYMCDNVIDSHTFVRYEYTYQPPDVDSVEMDVAGCSVIKKLLSSSGSDGNICTNITSYDSSVQTGHTSEENNTSSRILNSNTVNNLVTDNDISTEKENDESNFTDHITSEIYPCGHTNEKDSAASQICNENDSTSKTAESSCGTNGGKSGRRHSSNIGHESKGDYVLVHYVGITPRADQLIDKALGTYLYQLSAQPIPHPADSTQLLESEMPQFGEDQQEPQAIREGAAGDVDHLQQQLLTMEGEGKASKLAAAQALMLTKELRKNIDQYSETFLKEQSVDLSTLTEDKNADPSADRCIPLLTEDKALNRADVVALFQWKDKHRLSTRSPMFPNGTKAYMYHTPTKQDTHRCVDGYFWLPVGPKSYQHLDMKGTGIKFSVHKLYHKRKTAAHSYFKVVYSSEEFSADSYTLVQYVGKRPPFSEEYLIKRCGEAHYQSNLLCIINFFDQDLLDTCRLSQTSLPDDSHILLVLHTDMTFTLATALLTMKNKIRLSHAFVHRPNPGDVFLYDLRGKTENCLKDGYYWRKTKLRSNHYVDRMIFGVWTSPQGSIVSTKFARHVYNLKGNNDFLLVHYLGDKAFGDKYTRAYEDFYLNVKGLSPKVKQVIQEKAFTHSIKKLYDYIHTYLHEDVKGIAEQKLKNDILKIKEDVLARNLTPATKHTQKKRMRGEVSACEKMQSDSNDKPGKRHKTSLHKACVRRPSPQRAKCHVAADNVAMLAQHYKSVSVIEEMFTENPKFLQCFNQTPHFFAIGANKDVLDMICEFFKQASGYPLLFMVDIPQDMTYYSLTVISVMHPECTENSVVPVACVMHSVGLEEVFDDVLQCLSDAVPAMKTHFFLMAVDRNATYHQKLGLVCPQARPVHCWSRMVNDIIVESEEMEKKDGLYKRKMRSRLLHMFQSENEAEFLQEYANLSQTWSSTQKKFFDESVYSYLFLHSSSWILKSYNAYDVYTKAVGIRNVQCEAWNEIFHQKFHLFINPLPHNILEEFNNLQADICKASEELYQQTVDPNATVSIDNTSVNYGTVESR